MFPILERGRERKRGVERGERGRGRKGEGARERKKNVMRNRYQSVTNKQKTLYTGDAAWGIFFNFLRAYLYLAILKSSCINFISRENSKATSDLLGSLSVSIYCKVTSSKICFSIQCCSMSKLLKSK